MPAHHQPQLCPACGGANDCALAAGREPQSCWCWRVETRLPLPINAQTRCFCARCLARLTTNAAEDTRHDR